MTVILLDPRRPSLMPVEAVELLVGPIAYTEELPIAVPWALPAAHPVLPETQAPVLLSSDRDHPAVVARLAAGEKLICVPDAPAGVRLLDAVAMMDRLRTDGPWESEQTHDSLRRFLLEETYELFDAVRSGDAEELCAELGDVLLQVLFHARIAEEAPKHPFGIDDVADALLRKLRNRVPTVLAGQEISLEDQVAQWEERKALEKGSRDSIMDDLPTAQPALALAGKVLQRLAKAGVPADLIPETVTSITLAAGVDAENDLRTAVLEIMDTVRAVEKAIAMTRRGGGDTLDTATASLGEVSGDEWRAHWPWQSQRASANLSDLADMLNLREGSGTWRSMTSELTGEMVLYRRDDGTPALEVRFGAETVWLSQQQIAELFEASRTNIVEHIQHIYGEGELNEAATCRKSRQVRTEGSRQVAREIPYYNLDVIISVGYRVKSKVATQFRIWATERLRDYLVKGYALNEQRLEQVGSIVRILARSSDELVAGVADVLVEHLPGLTLLRDYDKGHIAVGPGAVPGWRLNLDEARSVIARVATEFPADGLIGKERGDALDGVIGAIYQSFGGQDLYPTVEEKAANLLQIAVKDHPLADGNKRSAAALFVTFLARNGTLMDTHGQPRITNNALAAITLMVAMSDPKEKDLMIALLVRMITEEV